MRWLVAVLGVSLLAGCAAPQEEPADPLFGLCPQWVQGHGEQTGGLLLDANGTARRELGPADERFLDLPLDLFRVHIDGLDTDGLVRLRATDADGQRLWLRDYRLDEPQVVPVVVLRAESAGHDFDVLLSPVLEDAEAAPVPAALELSLEGSHAALDYTVTYHYKVCGIDP